MKSCCFALQGHVGIVRTQSMRRTPPLHPWKLKQFSSTRTFPSFLAASEWLSNAWSFGRANPNGLSSASNPNTSWSPGARSSARSVKSGHSGDNPNKGGWETGNCKERSPRFMPKSYYYNMLLINSLHLITTVGLKLHNLSALTMFNPKPSSNAWIEHLVSQAWSPL